MDGARRTIGLVLFDGVEELDAIGPFEVLASWTERFPEDGFDLVTCSRSGDPVTCAHGLVVHATHGYDDLPPLEVLIYPGGRGTRPQLHDEAQLAWVRERRAEVPVMASVCTGSLVFAAAGLLAGRPATTHWASLERLAELEPRVELRAAERFVDDGDVVTSAGISAGIDMALHLVARFAGRERAAEVRRHLQYDPAPPV